MKADLVAAALPSLERLITGLTPPLVVEAVPGGTSNPTFFITDANRRSYVLRRPPSGGRLATAHDVGREYRAISALHAAGVPVPKPLAFAGDDSVLGVPFYLMERVDGLVLRALPDVELIDEPARARASLELAQTLARLHAVDPDEVGLGGRGRGAGYVERQLERWSQQAARSSEISGVPQPELLALHDLLLARVPEARRSSIVHGDFRLGNVIVDETGKLLAILDWELWTLGDPYADAAHLVVSWLEYGDNLPAGLYTPRRLAEAYALAAGGDLDHFPYYVAFASWRLASILTGVHARYVSGGGAAERVDPERYLRRIGWMAALSRRALAGDAFTAGDVVRTG